jgi:hypothetical protein
MAAWPLWFGIQIALAIVAVVFAWRGTMALKAWPIRILMIIFQVLVGLAVYFFVGLNYIVGSGIDSL